jgi:hypothetical protein
MAPPGPDDPGMQPLAQPGAAPGLVPDVDVPRPLAAGLPAVRPPALIGHQVASPPVPPGDDLPVPEAQPCDGCPCAGAIAVGPLATMLGEPDRVLPSHQQYPQRQ